MLGAVNDIETLAGGLSNKIWQKIMILDSAIPRVAGEREREANDGTREDAPPARPAKGRRART